MTVEAKKLAAAMAAVSEWMAEEEGRAGSPRPAAHVPSAWAASGREEIMRMRGLIIGRIMK
jgi:hypothetical protein